MGNINGSEKLVIFIHDNPDPDAIAASAALELICRSVNVPSTVYYSGEIGRPENEIFLEHTGFVIEKVEKPGEIVEGGGTIAFLDFARASVNNRLPEGVEPDIIIDHHGTNMDVSSGGFIEVRDDVGAASTLMTKHLIDLGLDVDEVLASALYYGIKTDTHDFTKNIHPGDFQALEYLSSRVDHELIDIFESPPLSKETIDALGRAITNRKVELGVMTSYVGEVSSKDDIAQIADILMGEKDVLVVLVFGLVGEKMYMSARNKDLDIDIGDIMSRAYSEYGGAGGHWHSAGGELDMSNFSGVEDAVEVINNIFLQEVMR
ncbi:MAG: DHHA1 domain-containing protein [Thermoplasmata archaeon]